MTGRIEHLDASTIAAFVDRTLDPAARAAAEAHLAMCADCREVWVETSEIAGDEDVSDWSATPSAASSARTRSRRWMYGGAGLAVAAALALVVFSPRLFDRGNQADRATLVRALSGDRRTDGRLIGGFAWSERPSVQRSATQTAETPAVVIAAAGAEEALLAHRDAQTLWAAGLTRLLTGRLADAAAALEEAARLEPDTAPIWSDLAVARLEMARRLGDPSAADRALQAADRALSLDNQLAEALFNRALALELLSRDRDAAAAWQLAAASELDAHWRAEARTRAEGLAMTR